MSVVNLLTESQKENLVKWRYVAIDMSLTTQLFDGMWNFFASLVPVYVAPNVLSLAGLLLLVYSWNLTLLSADAPRLVALAAALLTFAYQVLGAIDGKHARRTHNESPLGELFNHACDSIGTIFLISSLCEIIGVKDLDLRFYLLQGAQMVFLLEHVKALEKRVVVFSRYFGPGELISLAIFIMLARALGIVTFPASFVSSSAFQRLVQLLYYGVYLYSLFHCYKLYKKDPNNWGTAAGLFFCLFLRHVTAMLIFLGIVHEASMTSVIAECLVLSVVTCDLIVARMAARDLHPVVVIGSLISSFKYPSVDWVLFSLVALYYIKLLWETTQALHVSLLTPNRNIFASGVFDMFHYGHMESLSKFLVYGNRLLVGVHSDEEVASYKRKPMQTMEQRCRAVAQCRSVSQVIPSAPLIITKEFLLQHQIHVVVCSDEYDNPDDIWYRVPREMCILKVVPRTEGISTSALMKHVTHRYIEDMAPPELAKQLITQLDEAERAKKAKK